ncbi:hypothetical protein AB0K48_04555 [Nonomuraea sp. NPDC055795]
MTVARARKAQAAAATARTQVSSAARTPAVRRRKMSMATKMLVAGVARHRERPRPWP